MAPFNVCSSSHPSHVIPAGAHVHPSFGTTAHAASASDSAGGGGGGPRSSNSARNGGAGAGGNGAGGLAAAPVQQQFVVARDGRVGGPLPSVDMPLNQFEVSLEEVLHHRYLTLYNRRVKFTSPGRDPSH
ncbi:hypothetical protein MNEG_2265, partial [Monoraphidium neglectum]